MVVLGYGMTLDVQDLAFAALDGDESPESRDYVQSIAGSRYFVERPPIRVPADLDRRLKSGELAVAIEIPPGFGRDLRRGRSPEISAWVDGAMPFRGETIRGYVQGMHQDYLAGLAQRAPAPEPQPWVNLEMRYRYNQDFRSLDAMVPAVIPLLLLFVPAILTALARGAGEGAGLDHEPLCHARDPPGIPARQTASLRGCRHAQLPRARGAGGLLFGVALKGSLPALAVGALLYVATTTGFGLVMSAFTRTQIAALFGTAIATMTLATQFSGLTDPVSSLEGSGRADRQRIPDDLLPHHQPRGVHEGARLPRSVEAVPRPRGLHPGGDGRQSALAQEARPLSAMRPAVVAQLGFKELRSLWHDKVLLLFVLWGFSFGIYSAATASSRELHNAAIAVVDEDRSALSQRIVSAFYRPYFSAPALIGLADVDPGLDAGRYTFVLDIPPNFQRDVQAGRKPTVQVNIDATQMSQAFIGAIYIQNIVTSEVGDFVMRRRADVLPAIPLIVRVKFNPNLNGIWFGGVMKIVSNITLLSVILSGAALIREREHGTLEHLLVMPLQPIEIMAAKVWANGLVVLVTAGPLALAGRQGHARRSNRGLPRPVPLRRRLAPVLVNVARDLPGHRRPVHAPIRPADDPGHRAARHALGGHDAPREHADGRPDPHAGGAHHVLREIRAGDSLPRGGP